MRDCRILCILVLAALTGACATQAPPTGDAVRVSALDKIDINRAWAASSGSADPITNDWLQSFQDAELESLVREAVANNPDLRIAATRVEQAGGYLRVAQAALYPTAGIAGTGGAKSGGGGDVASALQGIVAAISWELDLWGRLRYARNAAREDYASVQADFEFARQSIAAATAKAWFAATQLTLRAAVAEQSVESGRRLQALAEERYRVGIGSEIEVATTRATVSDYEDTKQQTELARNQALRALELLLGRYPAAQVNARAELLAMPGPVPAGLPLEMLERRPDVIAAERRVAAAFNREHEAKAAFLPKITLSANVGAFDSEVLQLREDFENPTAGIGARVLAPIYQGGALKAQAQIRTQQQQQAIAEYARVALRALNEVENSLAASQSLATRVDLLNASLREQTRALEFTQRKLRVGNADERSVEQQRLTVQKAQLALLTARSEQLTERVNLHLALGGSFEAPREGSGSAE